MKRSPTQERKLWQAEVRRRWQRLIALEAACRRRLEAPALDDEQMDAELGLRAIRFAILSTYLDALAAGVGVDQQLHAV